MADPEGRFKGLVPREGFVPRGKKVSSPDVSKNGIPRGKFFVVEEDWQTQSETPLQSRLGDTYIGKSIPPTALRIREEMASKE